jgi:hypothetical protein
MKKTRRKYNNKYSNKYSNKNNNKKIWNKKSKKYKKNNIKIYGGFFENGKPFQIELLDQIKNVIFEIKKLNKLTDDEPENLVIDKLCRDYIAQLQHTIHIYKNLQIYKICDVTYYTWFYLNIKKDCKKLSEDLKTCLDDTLLLLTKFLTTLESIPNNIVTYSNFEVKYVLLRALQLGINSVQEIFAKYLNYFKCIYPDKYVKYLENVNALCLKVRTKIETIKRLEVTTV